MDEILASIRRIIETGDEKTTEANREAAVGAARQIPAFLAGGGAHDQAASTTDYHTHPSFAARAEPASAPHTLFPSFGDDDRLTAELETELAATWERIEVDRVGADKPHDAAASMEAGTSTARSEAMSNEPDMSPYGARHDAYSNRPVHEEAPQHQAAASIPRPQTHEAPMERNAFEPANTDARLPQEPAAAASRFGDTPPPLVSPSTGQLVGASFNELAEAIRLGELRSLDAMAQEMLQPMLRDWLDDNLPQMVERLIREEIERLARGGAKR